MIPASQAVEIIHRHRGRAVVVSTSRALREWSRVSQRRDLDVDLLDCLDKAASVGLGIASARPEVQVLVLDCGSTLRTNLEGMLTVGRVAPTKLVHFLLEDVAYRSTDGVAIPGLDGTDFAALARDAGYAKVYSFDDLEELDISLEETLETPGPVFVSVRVFHGPDLPPYPDRPMIQSFADVREALAAG